MNLQAQILTAHGIQEVESDGKLRPKPGEHGLPKKVPGLVQHQVHGRDLHHGSVEIKEQAVFLGHAVKAPGKIGSLRVQAADLLHPLAAPDARVEIGHRAEGTNRRLPQGGPEGPAADHLRPAGAVGVQQVSDGLELLRLVLIRNPPFHEKAPLVFFQDILVAVVRPVVAHSTAVTQLNLPSGQIGVHQQVAG